MNTATNTICEALNIPTTARAAMVKLARNADSFDDAMIAVSQFWIDNFMDHDDEDSIAIVECADWQAIVFWLLENTLRCQINWQA